MTAPGSQPMRPTARRMLQERSLGLGLLVEGDSLDRPIEWVHSSDLSDPTPFLEAGQMLLTTGTQFGETAPQDDFDAYVDRLAGRGIVAIGFGTEVARAGTPPELVVACEAAGLTLIEVPYRTPFIALVRWAADLIAGVARERDDWSLRAQRAISLAALGPRGLAGVLTALAQQLHCRVAVFGADGTFDTVLSPSQFDERELAGLRSEARRLLRGRRRSADSLVIESIAVTVQTLGPGSRLSGVLAVVDASIDDAAARAVVTSAIALTEISFEESRIRRGSLMPLHEELLSLLLAGQVDVALRARPSLPLTDIRLVLCDRESQSQWFADAVERWISAAGERLFLAPHGSELVVLVAGAEWAAFRDFLAEHGVSAGASAPAELSRLSAALAQARHALSRVAGERGGGVIEFDDVSDSAFLDIVGSQSMIDLATARLAALLDDTDGRELLQSAYVWLSHNGGWDSAAKELGMHRHSLKLRVETVAKSLSLSLDSFGDRAQLWSMLNALDFGAR
jgi:purine catabolism regulator